MKPGQREIAFLNLLEDAAHEPDDDARQQEDHYNRKHAWDRIKDSGT